MLWHKAQIFWDEIILGEIDSLLYVETECKSDLKSIFYSYFDVGKVKQSLRYHKETIIIIIHC